MDAKRQRVDPPTVAHGESVHAHTAYGLEYIPLNKIVYVGETERGGGVRGGEHFNA